MTEGKAEVKKKNAKDRVVKVFDISGTFKEKKTERHFKKQVSAFNENFAMEKIMALMGSNHKVKRRHININEIKEAKEGK